MVSGRSWRLSLALAAALITSACALDTLRAVGEAQGKVTQTRQQIDRMKIEASRAAWCGSGLDVHMEETGKRPAHAQAAAILCGAVAPFLLSPALDEKAPGGATPRGL